MARWWAPHPSAPSPRRGIQPHPTPRVEECSPFPTYTDRVSAPQFLEAVIAHASDRGAQLLWCNVRTAAIPFYKRAGFRVIGALWHDPDTGLHTAMHRLLHSRTGSC